MLRKLVTMALIGGSLTVAACNTVKGAAEDVNSVATCTEELMKQGQC